MADPGTDACARLSPGHDPTIDGRRPPEEGCWRVLLTCQERPTTRVGYPGDGRGWPQRRVECPITRTPPRRRLLIGALWLVLLTCQERPTTRVGYPGDGRGWPQRRVECPITRTPPRRRLLIGALWLV